MTDDLTFTPGEDDFVPIGDTTFADLSEDELEEYITRAMALVDLFTDPLRVGVRSIFAVANNAAANALEYRRQTGYSVYLPASMATIADPTAPPSHRLDDAGTAMAWVMEAVEDPNTSAGARRAWLRLLSALAVEVRRRQAQISP